MSNITTKNNLLVGGNMLSKKRAMQEELYFATDEQIRKEIKHSKELISKLPDKLKKKYLVKCKFKHN